MDLWGLASQVYATGLQQNQQYQTFRDQLAALNPTGSDAVSSSLVPIAAPQIPNISSLTTSTLSESQLAELQNVLNSGTTDYSALMQSLQNSGNTDLSSVIQSIQTSGTTDINSLLQSLQTSGTVDLTSLMQSVQTPSVIDPSSIVPGVGLGASNIPQAPSLDVYEQLNALQREHREEQDDYLQNVENNVLTKKEEVFATHHYETDEDGNRVLAEGGETAAQRLARLNQEQADRKALEDRQEAELKDFTARAQALANEMRSSSDPAHNEDLQARIAAMQQEEVEMGIRQKTEKLAIGTEGLPDPDNPGQTLSAYVDGEIQGYRQLVATQLQEENDSPAGQQINAYTQQVQAFTTEQQGILAQLGEQSGIIMDPDELRRLYMS